MRRKLSFSLALAAAISGQTLFTQSVQAQDLFCSRSSDAACSTYASAGFASYADCINFHVEYCAAIAEGGGCYYDPRQGYTICF